jgi:hypothetical protein
MAEEGKHFHGAANGLTGALWFAGWLFTIAYADLIWWKIILGLVIWPYYLGSALS